MIEIESHNVDFLEDEFQSIGEIKKDLKPYELQQHLQPFANEGEDLNSCQVIVDGELVQGNEVYHYSPISMGNQIGNAESPRA